MFQKKILNFTKGLVGPEQKGTSPVGSCCHRKVWEPLQYTIRMCDRTTASIFFYSLQSIAAVKSFKEKITTFSELLPPTCYLCTQQKCTASQGSTNSTLDKFIASTVMTLDRCWLNCANQSSLTYNAEARHIGVRVIEIMLNNLKIACMCTNLIFIQKGGLRESECFTLDCVWKATVWHLCPAHIVWRTLDM